MYTERALRSHFLFGAVINFVNRGYVLELLRVLEK
jgi:hypothetical protein